MSHTISKTNKGSIDPSIAGIVSEAKREKTYERCIIHSFSRGAYIFEEQFAEIVATPEENDGKHYLVRVGKRHERWNWRGIVSVSKNLITPLPAFR